MFENCRTLAGVGERNIDRQLAEARVAYLAAVRRLNTNIERFEHCGIALNPGPSRTDPIPWTPGQVQAIVAVSRAFRDVIDRRRTWDDLRRHRRPTH